MNCTDSEIQHPDVVSHVERMRGEQDEKGVHWKRLMLWV